ncbi:hypothetical protein TPHA_0M01540 [Tetrapisispora phaffii CBS 4417]|uniref:Pre-mRNA-splicing factor BRR1 n=1 Tax=Tetrapisispora phaffii (strain ATCC 24235 / CBS 4417 / NBRC 1672 / NRRL Y-8282 / UCD 70-5) TaxID=1071381 RepID=G8C0L4_TETPH|nr:hypothetical protein TPHA_0M01540 [Tetrapisispora phaffii CBS 4417]CCE65729.1 hypothetical protein TPHA_0M01540 [Tetrapisispora phaffii CBS 4417]
MSDKSSQRIDPVFGQSRAFALNDPLVNPDILKYLEGVKEEAIRSTFETYSEKKPRNDEVKHIASMYDDDGDSYNSEVKYAGTEVYKQELRFPERHSYLTKYPESLIKFQRNMPKWVKWFKRCKIELRDTGYVFEGYDNSTMELILYHLQEYLNIKRKKGFPLHLFNILKDVTNDVEEKDKMTIDSEWLETIFNVLKSRRLKGIADVIAVISEMHSFTPMGFKQWYAYIIKNEPSHSIFVNIINNRNMWILLQYMTKTWVKTINLNKKPTESKRLSQWLIYMLLHLPEHLTAEYISELRSLAKKCRDIILTNITDTNEATKESNVLPYYTQELIDMGLAFGDDGTPTIIELTLSVVSEIYGQRDLTNWENM